jgi:hypothetical protein
MLMWKASIVEGFDWSLLLALTMRHRLETNTVATYAQLEYNGKGARSVGTLSTSSRKYKETKKERGFISCIILVPTPVGRCGHLCACGGLQTAYKLPTHDLQYWFINVTPINNNDNDNDNNNTMAANCVIDRDVLNADTYPDFNKDIGLAVFAPLCGKNRGAFVLNPTDGKTWGCAGFPPSFAERANVESGMIIKDSNAIQMQCNGGNITGAEAVDLVDLFVQSVFFSSEGVELDPTACDVNGFATLACQTSPRSIPTMGEDKIRAVTLAGVLAPEAWATGGKPLIKTINPFLTIKPYEVFR